ncbi:MAG: Flp pilus assembly complex ATPase component TadA [Phycisphaeraceae bacterium]|nr:Flp pilus assembly complex ATPase component TadA [Phycisphaeraceae bacterium]
MFNRGTSIKAPDDGTSASAGGASTSVRSRNGHAGEAKPVRVGDLLVERKVITPEQLAQALASQKERGHKKLLGEVICEMKFATEEQVLEVLAGAYGVPFARVSPKIADPKVIEILPREMLEKQCALPLFVVNGKLTVAVNEPANVFLLEEMERVSGCTIQVVAATARDILATLQSYLPNANVFVIDEIVDDIQSQDLTLVEKEVTDLTNLADSASHSPVIKLVNFLIHGAVQDGASDIHIEPGDGVLRVRFRVDGSMFEKMKPPHQMQPAVVSRIKIMAGLDISERRVPQDGGITVMLNKRPVDLRVSTMPGKFGEKVVMRIIDNRNTLTSLEKIGFSYTMLENFRQVLHQPNGVVLVTGPTGSGKSTTLYGMLNEILDDSLNICTVEDPVEYNLPGVNQFQVNEKAGFTFSGALRALLRQDPDVIMVGEIRDQETAKIATQAALTGHLVLSTLHTNDAPSAITRLFNIGVEPYLVAASIRGVLAQRLLRKVCSSCKEAMEITPQVRRTLDKITDGAAPIETLYKGAGCSKCRNTGYAGRIGVFELFTPDDEVLDAVSRGASLQEIRRLARAGGYVTLQQDGIEKLRAGITTVEELFSATSVG